MPRVLLLILIFHSSLLLLAQNASPRWVGGIQVHEENNADWTKNLKRSGLNTVEVTVYAKQGDWDSDNLWFEEKDTLIAYEIRAAKKRGMKVVLILRVALDHAFPRNKFLWHGLILPKDEMLESWFAKYQRFIRYWSRFANKEGVDMIGISSEMNALTSTLPIDKLGELEDFYLDLKNRARYDSRYLKFKDEISERHLWVRGDDKHSDLREYIKDRATRQYKWAMQVTYNNDDKSVQRINQRSKKLDLLWRQTIAVGRKEFKGDITYAANFDSYHKVGFWDALDLIGINAYFKIKNLEQVASKENFSKNWTSILNEISAQQKQLGVNKPVMFTELGYTYRKNCSVEPWNSHGFSVTGKTVDQHELYVWPEQPLNFNERAEIVAGLRQALAKTNFNLRGVLYWKLSSHRYHFKNEPFLLVLDGKDPLLQELKLLAK